MPLVMAKVAAETLAPGERLSILATDPEASVDLAAWAADEGHTLAERDREDCTEFVVRMVSAA